MVETLRRVVENNAALARFGDGELKLAFYGRGLRFQNHSRELAAALNRVLLMPRERLLVCFNSLFAETAEWPWIARYQRYGKVGEATRTLHAPDDIMIFRRPQQRREYRRHWKIIEKETEISVYGAATVFFLGLYVDNYADGTMEEVLDLFRALFAGRRILFVGPAEPTGGDSFRRLEGAMRRLGLREATFIDVPATNAFEYSDEVVRTILNTTQFDDVFLQAGPAATVWASELAGRIEGRVLDVGSLNTQLGYLE
jgi:hypothetical protein